LPTLRGVAIVRSGHEFAENPPTVDRNVIGLTGSTLPA
jgi:hypothetical protein